MFVAIAVGCAYIKPMKTIFFSNFLGNMNPPRIYKIQVLIVYLFLVPKGVVCDEIRDVDPFQLYPRGILFDVRRNDETVGHHKVNFSKEVNDQMLVTSQLKLKVKVLGIIVYSYDYHSEAWWTGSHLVKLLAKQNDDGAVSVVKVSAKKNVLMIDGPSGNFQGRSSLYPSNHWHVGVIVENQLIDTLKGQIASVKINSLGIEKVFAKDRVIYAQKYIYSGDVNATAWYDEFGRWVKFSFAASDGSIIEYNCIECGLEK